MFKKNLETLEFHRIKDILKTYAKTYLGQTMCLELEPFSNKKDIYKALKQTTEASILLYRKGNLPLEEIENISPYLKKIEASICLSAKELLALANILKLAKNLKTYFSSDEIDMSEFIYLNNFFNNLYTNFNLEQTIFTSILDENTIADNVSKDLANIRKNIKDKEQEIRNKLNSFIHTKYVQEPVITIRNSRFVIPIKNEYRSQIKGFVHDISASGSTVFIEPLNIFDLNNDLNSLRNDENIEIQKILMNLSSLFFDLIDNLQNNINLIGLIDFIFAKAKYSNSLDAIEPNINDDKFINLLGAYHPLISKELAIKNDITLGQTFSNLIITGPNTGGKTVTLKTVGLLVLMAMSGLHITAKENSSIYIFDNIFADIGDEQSVLNSLSTFSSHITNISNILNLATENSLILLDELGIGTDPIEGSSLAISILENLNNRNILNISTTHYSELKTYALVTNNFKNASMELNLETLTPTYRLLIGVPGTSNAFAISKKLGISEDIILRATQLLSSDEIRLEELLKNIYEDKRLIEQEKQNILNNSKEIESLKQTLKNDISKFEEKKKNLLALAQQEARDIMLSAKQEANELIKEIEQASTSQTLHNTRLKLNNKIKDLNSSNLSTEINSENTLNENTIKLGMEVFIPAINQNGNIIAINIKNKTATVQFGLIKSIFHFDKIFSIPNTSQNNDKKTYNKKHNFTVKTVSSEINVIGLNIDEACFDIDKYLDNCALTGIPSIRIVHGKGTGALRTGIHKFLKTHPHVKSFRVGTFGEGEMGVTIVEIK